MATTPQSTPTAAPSPSNLFAAVEMGTNSFKLLIVTANPTGKFIALHRQKQPILLGLDSTTTISPDSETRALTTLDNFMQTLNSYKVDPTCTIFVATSAVREASNKDEFCESVKRAVGIDVRVLSGEEEARYAYLGVLQFLPVFGKQVLAVDIGGGSTEFVVGKEGNVLFGRSVKLGHVSLTMMFSRNGELDLEGMREYVRRVVLESGVVDGVREVGFEMVVGSSGTIKSIEKAVSFNYAGELFDSVELVGRGKRDWIFSLRDLKGVIGRLCGDGEKERARRELFFDARSDFILAGALLLEGIFDLIQIEHMEFSGYTVGEGVIAERLADVYDGYNLNANVRWQSVVRLSSRLNSKKRMNFAAQCAYIAKEIFEGLRNNNQFSSLDGKDLEYLEVACLLHNVGLLTSKKGYHKESYRIIKNGDYLHGYNDDEIEFVALLARHHRKKIPKAERAPFKHFSEEARQKFTILLAIMRISVVVQQYYQPKLQGLKFFHCHEGFTLVLDEGVDQFQLPLHHNAHLQLDDSHAELRREGEYFKMAVKQNLTVMIPAGGSGEAFS